MLRGADAAKDYNGFVNYDFSLDTETVIEFRSLISFFN